MATRDEIYAAMRNADAAGDADAVRALSSHLRSMAAPTAPRALPKPVGGGLGAFARGVFDTATFGTMDELAAGADTLFGRNRGSKTGWTEGFGPAFRHNVNMQRGIIAADEKDNGSARLGGQVVGALAMPGAAAGAPLKTRALVNAGQGALYGAGSGQGGFGQRAISAGKGAVAAAGAGEAGRFVGKAIGRAVVPRTVRAAIDPAVRGADKHADKVLTLADEGVTMTPGAIMGGGWKAAEDRVAGYPVVGDFIKARQADSLDDFNAAGFNRALKSIGQTLPKGLKSGPDAHAFTQRAFDEVYDKARSGMEFAADETFNSALDDLQQRAAAGALAPDKAARLNAIVQDQLLRRAPDGRMDGDTYKLVASSLKKQAHRFSKATATAEENELGDVLSELVSHLDAAARRSSDPAAAKLMDAADEGYAQLVRVENAGRMRGGEIAVYTPNQLDAAVQRGDQSARSRAYLRGDALMQDLASAGRGVLPSKVPDSGTAGRLALGSTALGYVEPTTLLATGPLTVPYLPGLGRGVQDLLTRRPRGMIGAWQRSPEIATPYLGSSVGLLAAEQVSR